MDKQLSKILIVDDEAFYTDILVNLLQDEYELIVAKDGSSALQHAFGSPSPDLILLDIHLPDIDGYEVCRKLKADPQTKDIPIIFLTINSDVNDEIKGFELGAVDYITKPISPPIVKSRVKNHLTLVHARDVLTEKKNDLEKEIKERTREIILTQDIAILSMTSLAETRDNDTGHHIRRTQHYVRALAQKLQSHPAFCDYLDEQTINLLFKSAPLHDIGKVGVPDRVLLKPGPLNMEEWEKMKLHSQFGYDAILRAENELGGRSTFLKMAAEIALTHHERWDGRGYPNGLKAYEIPVSGRLMALADVYDALVSERIYKESSSHEQAVDIIQSESGTHFDPDIVEAFTEIESEFLRISNEFSD